MNWFARNLSLLIGGLILLPITSFFVLMGLALGVGFSDKPKLEALKLLALLISYLLVYSVCLVMSLRKYKVEKTYGFWDVGPIFFFAAIAAIALSL